MATIRVLAILACVASVPGAAFGQAATGGAVVVDTARSQDEHKQVLVLYSTFRDSQFSVTGERELQRILEIRVNRNLDYYSEFIDAARFAEPSYQIGFRDFLRVKYRGIRFDLLIAMQDVAIEFLNQNRNSLFPNVPEVFLATHRSVQAGPNSTGLIQERNFAGTIPLIEKLHPNASNIFVVSGAAPSDKLYENELRTQLRSVSSRLTINYLSGLATPELMQRLAALPDRSVVYLMLVTQDGAGAKFRQLEYVDRVAAAANAPTYSWVDSAMNHGIVGGNLYSQTETFRRTSQLAVRVLRGERADSIETVAVDLTSNQVDWRQLRRWGIDEALVPAGTIISYREDTIWDRYQRYILAAIGLLIVQSGLIAGLLIQAGQRRRAEVELRRSQGHLRASYDRIRDLGSRLLRAQETERSRIARELHDDINQQVAVLTMDLELAGDADATEVKRLTAEARGRALEIATSLRALSHRLHPAGLRLIGLIPALQALRLELSNSGVAIGFTYDGIPSTLSPDLTLCLFRVVQEALRNATKHSKSREISVHLGATSSGLTVSVIDDGVGFDVEAMWGRGLGLLSMKERLEAFGGSLDIRSNRAFGTRLVATVPLSVVASSEAIQSGTTVTVHHEIV